MSLQEIPAEVWGWYGDESLSRRLRVVARAFGGIRRRMCKRKGRIATLYFYKYGRFSYCFSSDGLTESMTDLRTGAILVDKQSTIISGVPQYTGTAADIYTMYELFRGARPCV